MSSPFRKGGGGGSNSHRNYKYRRLASVENGSDNCYISRDEDEEEIFTSQATELKRIGGRNNGSDKSSSAGTSAKFVTDYEQLVDRPIQTGETLAGIALKYSIPVSELKRINKIIQEKEFFALKSLKIPVKANSVLAEILQEEQKQDSCSENETVASTRVKVLGTRSVNSCSECESDNEMHVGYISIDCILRDTRTKEEAKRFLDAMQKDLADIREKTHSYKDSLDEVAAVLTSPRFRPLDQTEDKCAGSDWGITWWKMLLGGTVILVGVPLLYIYMYLENK